MLAIRGGMCYLCSRIKQIDMSTIATNIPTSMPILDSYWNTLRSLSDDIKLRLAAMLTVSVVEKDKEETDSSILTKRMLDKYGGAWKGDESADEIMAAIRENSSIRKPIEL